MFDPDYRTKGWSRSRFAPKNYSNIKKGKKATPITDIAKIVGGVVGLIIFAGLYSIKFDIVQTIVISLGVGFVLFLITGRTVFRREKKRLFETHGNSTDKKIDLEERSLKKTEQYHKMSPDEFEEHVAWLITKITPYSTKRVGGSGDGGVDVEVYKGNRKVGIIQCKRYQPDKSLPPSFVRELASTRALANVKTAYLVTNARFSKQTVETAKVLGIHLIDGKKLQEMDAKLKHI